MVGTRDPATSPLAVLTPILAQRIRPQSGMLAGWSVELEAEGASAPPRDFDVGEVGLAEHRGVGAPVEPYDDGVLVVEDDAAGGQEPSLEGVGGGVVVAGEPAAQ